MNDNYEFGNKIKKLRRKNFTTVNELSEMFKSINHPVSAKTIYKWESGKLMPDINTLIKISYFFNVSMSYFVDNYRKCQALTDSELEFLTKLRTDKTFKKLITLLVKENKEGEPYER